MSHKAFVTGATGFVGSRLAAELCAQDWEVHILARPSSSLQDLGDLPVIVHRGDVVDAASIADALPAGADAVFHVAASTNLWARRNAEQTRVNVGGTRNMLEAAIAAGARRFVHTSSFVAWGLLDGAFTEETPRTDGFDWINYVRTKHESERLVLESVQAGRIDAVVLNPGNVLGAGDRHNWSRMFRMIQQGKLPGAPPGGGNFCDVGEVARAQVRAWSDGRTGQRYLLGGEYAPYLEVIGMAGEILQRSVPSRPAPAWFLRAAAKFAAAYGILTGKEPDITPEGAALVTHSIRCDSGKAERELGYRSVPVHRMVSETIEWMRAQGLLR
jgi:nucleoside-diphosphate-sugar epimerase